jgi:hypothetical protein
VAAPVTSDQEAQRHPVAGGGALTVAPEAGEATVVGGTAAPPTNPASSAVAAPTPVAAATGKFTSPFEKVPITVYI